MQNFISFNHLKAYQKKQANFINAIIVIILFKPINVVNQIAINVKIARKFCVINVQI